MRFNLIVFRFIVFGLMTGMVAGVAIANPKALSNFATRDVPSFVSLVQQKLKTIITPRPPIGNLSVVRDLRGTWSSSIRGKGFQLYGQFATGPGTTHIYEDGDITLVINTVQNNVAIGTIRYTNMSVYGTTSVPGYGNLTVPRQYTGDAGTQPIRIGVSGTRLNFGSMSTNDATFSMQGNYTTSLISGTMTATTSYGVIKGEFHLIKVR